MREEKDEEMVGKKGVLTTLLQLWMIIKPANFRWCEDARRCEKVWEVWGFGDSISLGTKPLNKIKNTHPMDQIES